MLTEQQIIKGCQGKDKSCQYELVKRYSKMLRGVCRRYARDESAVQDILQETLIRVFSNINKFQSTGSFEGWLKKIAVRCSLTWMDKSYFKREESLTKVHDARSVVPAVYHYLGVQEIHLLINELPVGFRTVFNLYVIEGFSHKEIAEILEITESASRSQLTRAKSQLRKKLASRNIKNFKSL